MLPIAHTCFFQLELPQYTTDKVMHDRLLVAINYGVSGEFMLRQICLLESRESFKLDHEVELEQLVFLLNFMGIILEKPIVDKEVFTFSQSGFKGAMVSMQGWRSGMEVTFGLRLIT